MLALYSIVIGLYCHWLSLYFIGLYWAANGGIVSVLHWAASGGIVLALYWAANSGIVLHSGSHWLLQAALFVIGLH